MDLSVSQYKGESRFSSSRIIHVRKMSRKQGPMGGASNWAHSNSKRISCCYPQVSFYIRLFKCVPGLFNLGTITVCFF